MSPILGIYASQISGHLLPFGAYDSIATTTVGAGGTSTITFSSIPSTYTHLQIRAIARDSATGSAKVTFNSDTASNYSAHALYGEGTTAAAASLLTTYIPIQRSGFIAIATNTFSGIVMDILDYANTNKYKTTRSLAGWDANGTGYINFESGSWRNTAAITSITITSNGTAYQQYSSFALYGIKGN
jgi:hypothetical protein